MNKFQKSKNALSPVQASVVLIGGIIAVGVVVAVLMGSLAISSLESNELRITNVDFTVAGAPYGRIVLDLANPQVKEVTVQLIKVNDEVSNTWSSATSNTIPPEATETFTIIQHVVAGTQYKIDFYDVDGTMIASCTGSS